MNSSDHPYAPRDRDREKHRGRLRNGEGDSGNSGYDEREGERNKATDRGRDRRDRSGDELRGMLSFDGERDEYNTQLFDLLDKIEISNNDW